MLTQLVTELPADLKASFDIDADSGNAQFSQDWCIQSYSMEYLLGDLHCACKLVNQFANIQKAIKEGNPLAPI